MMPQVAELVDVRKRLSTLETARESFLASLEQLEEVQSSKDSDE
jgi:hypothetical protein